jgi:anthranilate phosphoribosyltransferase
MDPASLATAMIGAQMSREQMAAAATMMRMNADSAASVVKIIDAAQQNMQSLANVSAGVGQNVNITA